MLKVTDIFQSKSRTFSFEIFPPRTDQGYQALLSTLAELAKLSPDFISVTYGAGGSSRDKTMGIVCLIQERYALTALHHFTCVVHTKSEIKAIVDHLKVLGICNLLALRGDPPKETPNWMPGPENFQHSADLISFIRQNYGDFFSIGVAGFPEGHILAPSLEFDADIMKKKIEAGGDFVISQLFFENKDYFYYVRRLRALGLNVRVIPGILPVTNYEGTVNFCQGCGAAIPQRVHDIFRPIADDKDKVLAAGTELAIEQCRELLSGGAPGIHFYTLNKAEPVKTIINSIKA